MKVVADTNIWVLGILHDNDERNVMRQLRDRRVEFLLSVKLADEISRVVAAHIVTKRDTLKRPADFEDHLQKVIKEVGRAFLMSTFVDLKNKKVFAVCAADPEDDKVINCALHDGADCIVTNDKHLLDLNGTKVIDDFPPLQVLKPVDFLAHLWKTSVGKKRGTSRLFE